MFIAVKSHFKSSEVALNRYLKNLELSKIISNYLNSYYVNMITHNPKVVGSNPASATKRNPVTAMVTGFLILSSQRTISALGVCLVLIEQNCRFSRHKIAMCLPY